VAGRLRELLRDLKRTKARLKAASFGEHTQAWSGFSSAVRSDGALSGKHKALIALAIGLSKQCSPCVAYYTEAALSQGATKDEILEATFVAVLMDGGPAYAHVGWVVEALDEFGSET
jgi:AhpD family alkylhydroperoxidase